jgi:hypothetical protein
MIIYILQNISICCGNFYNKSINTAEHTSSAGGGTMTRTYKSSQIQKVVPVQYYRNRHPGIYNAELPISFKIGLVLPKKDGGNYIATLAHSRMDAEWVYEVENALNDIRAAIDALKPDISVWFWRGIPYCKMLTRGSQDANAITLADRLQEMHENRLRKK